MAEITKNLGMFEFAANFKVKAAEALDPRMVAASKADLINKANWPSDGDTIYVYKGLIVDCGSDGVYRLIDPALALDAEYRGWERIDAGGVKIDNIYTYKGSKATYAELEALVAPQVGDVWNVEEEHTITVESELGDSTTKTYLAGTNWVWNGTAWDALAGAIDMSAYATKLEVSTAVSTINESVSANALAIEGLNTSVGALELNVANKVEKVEGESLISSEKLQLIDTNAGAISVLQSQNLDSRISSLEGMFKDGETNIDLSEITSTLTANTGRIQVLENNSATKTELQGVQSQVNGHGERLLAIESVNVEQSEVLTSLTGRVEGVEAYGALISSLTGTVNGHTESISNINSKIEGLAVKSVKADEKVLSVDATGALSTAIALDYDAENKKIQLKGIQGAVVDELDATLFIKDGMLDSATFDEATKEIVLTWNTASGKTEAMRVPVGSLVDIYTAGSGLSVASNQFSVKVDPTTGNKLTVGENGLMVDISADIIAMDASVDNKIKNAFSWNIVE